MAQRTCSEHVSRCAQEAARKIEPQQAEATARNEELSDLTDKEGDVDDIDLRADDVVEDSGEEHENETPAKKRLRLSLNIHLSILLPTPPFLFKCIVSYFNALANATLFTARNGYPSEQDNIFLKGGVFPGFSLLISVLISFQISGILVPIPQYPLYTAALAQNKGRVVPYYLGGPQTDPYPSAESIAHAIVEAKSKGSYGVRVLRAGCSVPRSLVGGVHGRFELVGCRRSVCNVLKHDGEFVGWRVGMPRLVGITMRPLLVNATASRQDMHYLLPLLHVRRR